MSAEKLDTLQDEAVALSQFLDAMFRSPPALAEPVAPVTTAADTETGVATSTEAPVSAATLARFREQGGELEVMQLDLGILKLTVPLVDLGCVMPMPAQLSEMPGQAAWALGVVPHQGRNIPVVDTARLVMPANADPQRVLSRQIVLIEGERWGLACNGVSAVFRIAAADVQWRKPGARNAWLAGTVKSQMSGLLDVPAFIDAMGLMS